jgi:catechol 2,3-dioxygenase-like lactoylglutathione lyase family enzyme
VQSARNDKEQSMTRTSIVPQLFDVTLRASNVEELGQFYTKLGLRRAVDDDDVKVFILGVNELEIRRVDVPEEQPVTQPVTIEVRAPQLEQLEHRLRQEAIGYEGPQHDETGLALIVRDPNGNRVSFVQAHS